MDKVLVLKIYEFLIYEEIIGIFKIEFWMFLLFLNTVTFSFIFKVVKKS